MNTHLTIVTGGSRGLGLAIAAQRLAEGHRVLVLARTKPEAAWSAPAGAAGSHSGLTSWQVDLADPAPVAERLERWLSDQRSDQRSGQRAGQRPESIASATLINNAGVVSRLATLADVDAADLSNALRVGLEAPLLLSAAFLRATRKWALPRKLLFISSGLGRRAMAGSVSYCAAKAGMDHLARALALEEAARPDGARVVSLAPGVIDTDMQVQLRSADPALFADRATFVGLKTEGRLDSPEAAAAKVLRVLDRADFGSNAVADVRDA